MLKTTWCSSLTDGQCQFDIHTDIIGLAKERELMRRCQSAAVMVGLKRLTRRIKYSYLAVVGFALMVWARPREIVHLPEYAKEEVEPPELTAEEESKLTAS